MAEELVSLASDLISVTLFYQHWGQLTMAKPLILICKCSQVLSKMSVTSPTIYKVLFCNYCIIKLLWRLCYKQLLMPLLQAEPVRTDWQWAVRGCLFRREQTTFLNTPCQYFISVKWYTSGLKSCSADGSRGSQVGKYSSFQGRRRRGIAGGVQALRTWLKLCLFLHHSHHQMDVVYLKGF